MVEKNFTPDRALVAARGVAPQLLTLDALLSKPGAPSRQAELFSVERVDEEV